MNHPDEVTDLRSLSCWVLYLSELVTIGTFAELLARIGSADPTCASFFCFVPIHGLIGEGNGTRLQHSCLENPMDRGVWWAVVHGVAKSRIRLNDFIFTFHFHALEKEVATHSSVLAWRIPGTGEPDGLLSMGLHRVGHD